MYGIRPVCIGMLLSVIAGMIDGTVWVAGAICWQAVAVAAAVGLLMWKTNLSVPGPDRNCGGNGAGDVLEKGNGFSRGRGLLSGERRPPRHSIVACSLSVACSFRAAPLAR